MKIIKHTFKIPKLRVVDGELIEDGYMEETCTFTLLHKGVGLYEELADKPLMASLVEFNGENVNDNVKNILNKDFIRNLACASYVKIENNTFHNNRSTAEEFKKKPFFNKINEDLSFVEKLINMSADCLTDKNVADKVKKGTSPKK